ncbi:MAG: M28 family peptidase [Planctomycetia bacterium]
MRRASLLALALLALLPRTPQRASAEEAWAWAGAPVALAPTQGPELSVEDLRAHLEVLASDAFEGRMTAEPGGQRAARYVADGLARAGLQPRGSEGWYQPYVLSRPVLGEGNLLRARRAATGAGPGEELRLAVTQDWNPLSVTASRSVRAPLAFGGFGISAPDDGHDDYAQLDVKGKVLLVLRKSPPGKPTLLRQAPLLAKVGQAVQHGALGVLLVNDTATAREEQDGLFPWNQDIGAPTGSAQVPVAFLTRAAAARLVALAGMDLERLETASCQAQGACSLEGVEVELTTALGRTQQANTANVVGFLPGSDPALAREVVIVGAHHDHVGMGSGGASLGGPKARGVVHNGADDNGSGTVALLELAEWFGAPAHRTRRSLLFLSFSGEELGLLGSQHYVEHPLLPLADTVAMVNLDMVGRSQGGKLEVGGVGTARGLQDLVAAANRELGLSLTWDPQGEAPSDSTSFFQKKIPVLFMFTGLHDDYHRPSDDVEKVNFPDLLRITRLTAEVVRTLADRDERLQYTDPPRPARRPRLGITPGREADPRGVPVAGVAPGGPAATAGLQAGDVLLALAGQAVRTLQDLQEVLRKLEPGKAVPLRLLRDGKELAVDVVLGE